MTQQRQWAPFEVEFHKLLVVLSQKCDFVIEKEMAQAYNSAVRPYGFDRAMEAVNEILLERRPSDRFPSIKQLIEKICPQPSDDAIASETAALIVAMRTRKGNNWGQMGTWDEEKYKTFDDAMGAVIGELGVQVIKRMGGWSIFCHQFERNSQTEAIRAQIKQLAKGLIEKARAGVLDELPRLPESQASQAKQLAAGSSKDMQRADPRALLGAIKKP